MRVNIITLAMIVSFVSSSAFAKEFILIDNEKGIATGNWSISNEDLNAKDTSFTIQNNVLKGGKQEGSDVITQ